MKLRDLIAKHGGKGPKTGTFRDFGGDNEHPFERFMVDAHGIIVEQARKQVSLEDLDEDDPAARERIRELAEQAVDEISSEHTLAMGRGERERVIAQLVDEVLGLGPLEPLIRRDDINEIMVNGPERVYIEKDGEIVLTDVHFLNEAHLLNVIDRIVSPIGRRVDESQPYVDARLRDGSRVNVILPPLILQGPTVTIRKFARDPYTVEDLLEFGTLTRGMRDTLRAAVLANQNILISGGTGSGKTTTLNCLSAYIPHGERIVTLEDSVELQLQQEHVLQCETRDPNPEGEGEVTMRDLVRNSLRMRPDRIIVGECRGGEAFDMMQAMNTGHDGSMTTIHANDPRAALERLNTLILMAGMEIPERAVREHIATALDLIVQQDRYLDGSRKISKISELQGMEGDTILLSDIFEYRQTGVRDGEVVGEHRATGVRPAFFEQAESMGVNVPDNLLN